MFGISTAAKLFENPLPSLLTRDLRERFGASPAPFGGESGGASGALFPALFRPNPRPSLHFRRRTLPHFVFLPSNPNPHPTLEPDKATAPHVSLIMFHSPPPTSQNSPEFPKSISARHFLSYPSQRNLMP